MKPYIILVVEDDADIREGVRILLEGDGCYVKEAKNGNEGLKKFTDNVSLVILDIMMPGISGIKICEEIRKISNVPILFLTAKGQESDKVIGLMAGGDDYLVKPFSYAELLARVKALIRRHSIYDKLFHTDTETKIRETSKWIEKSDIKINTDHNNVILRGEEIKLTGTEYKILLLMMKYPQKIFSIQNLYESVWEEPFAYTSSNTVMVHIRKLRKKLEKDPQKPKIIETVWGKGYRFGE